MASVRWPRDHINRPSYFLSSCWDQHMGSPGRRWMEGNRMRSVNLFPWLPPLKFSRYNYTFFKVSSSAGLCLSSTDVPFSHFSGSRLITTHFIAPNSHNLITLLKYFHFCILFIWFLNASIYFYTWKHWTWRNMTIKFKVTQPVASQWMTVGRNQNIPLPGTEASLKQIKQTKRWRCSLDHRAGSSVGLTWKIGGGGVQPLLSGMCLFSPPSP